MKNVLLLVCVAIVLAGCASRGIVPMEQQLLTPSKEWTAAYGDSERSRLYYNMAVHRLVLNQHAKTINSSLATSRPAMEPTTQPIP